MVKSYLDQYKSFEITIHNANKCTFDGRDCFIVCLLWGGQLAFDKNLERYDVDATAEFTNITDAMLYAEDLGKRRSIKDFFYQGKKYTISV